jgi:hypothetical protein
MNLTIYEVIVLKYVCIKAECFTLASRFRDEEKRLAKTMTKSDLNKVYEEIAAMQFESAFSIPRSAIDQSLNKWFIRLNER